MEGFKRALSCAEIKFNKYKELKKKYDNFKNEADDEDRNNYYFIIFEHDYKLDQLWMLFLKSIVNNMPMTYYLSICKKLFDHLNICLDIEMNEGHYLTWTAQLRQCKEVFDEIVDDYTEYKIQQIKVTYLNNK